MKKLLAITLSLLLLFGLCGCSDLALLGLDIATDVILDENSSGNDSFEESYYEDGTEDPLYQDPESKDLDEYGSYFSAEEVSLYIFTYGKLPNNYITKSEARELGWEGGSVQRYAPGCAIGGDTFGNREGLLPKAPGRTYYECDIDTDGEDSRGAKRIVFSNDGLIYYTEDHYESFILLYGEE